MGINIYIRFIFRGNDGKCFKGGDGHTRTVSNFWWYRGFST